MLSNCVRRAASRVSAPLARQYSSIIARPTCSQLVASNRLTDSNQKTSASFSSFTGKHEVYGTRVVYELGGKPKAPTHSPAEIEKLVLSTIQSFDRFPEGKTGGIIGVNHLTALSVNLTIHKTQIRHFGDKPPLSQKTVGDRIMLVLRLYDKIDANKVVEVVLTMDTHLMNDLGLDSLDHVEIIMAIEDEFTTEIPDGDAENLMTPRQIYQYICDVEDVIE